MSKKTKKVAPCSRCGYPMDIGANRALIKYKGEYVCGKCLLAKYEDDSALDVRNHIYRSPNGDRYQKHGRV